MSRGAGFTGSANTERSFAARLLPTAPFHDDPDQHADRLTKPRVSPRLCFTEEAVDLRLRLQFSHHASQWRAVVMQLGFFHPSLTVGVIEKREHAVKGLLLVSHHVGKRFALGMAEEICARDLDCWHAMEAFGLFFARAEVAPAVILPSAAARAMDIPRKRRSGAVVPELQAALSGWTLTSNLKNGLETGRTAKGLVTLTRGELAKNSPDRRRSGEGWLTGLEPATFGTTITTSTVRKPRVFPHENDDTAPIRPPQGFSQNVVECYGFSVATVAMLPKRYANTSGRVEERPSLARRCGRSGQAFVCLAPITTDGN